MCVHLSRSYQTVVQSKGTKFISRTSEFLLSLSHVELWSAVPSEHIHQASQPNHETCE